MCVFISILPLTRNRRLGLSLDPWGQQQARRCMPFQETGNPTSMQRKNRKCEKPAPHPASNRKPRISPGKEQGGATPPGRATSKPQAVLSPWSCTPGLSLQVRLSPQVMRAAWWGAEGTRHHWASSQLGDGSLEDRLQPVWINLGLVCN